MLHRKSIVFMCMREKMGSNACEAVEDDVRNVANVANTSKFLRWLVERYIAQNAK